VIRIRTSHLEKRKKDKHSTYKNYYNDEKSNYTKMHDGKFVIRHLPSVIQPCNGAGEPDDYNTGIEVLQSYLKEACERARPLSGVGT
jgi:hypothetical protein